ELRKISSIQRQVDNPPGVYDRPESSVFGAQQDRRAGYLHGLSLLPNLHHKVQSRLLLEFEFDAGPDFCLEPRRRAAYLILSNFEQRERVVARLVSLGGADIVRGRTF